MYNVRRVSFALFVVIVVSFFSYETDFTNFYGMIMTANFFILFLLIPFLILFISYDKPSQNLVTIRFGRKRFFKNRLSLLMFPMLLLFLYLSILLMNSQCKINYFDLILFVFAIILVYFSIINVSIILDYKSIPLFISIAIGMFMLVVTILVQGGNLSLQVYLFICFALYLFSFLTICKGRFIL